MEVIEKYSDSSKLADIILSQYQAGVHNTLKITYWAEKERVHCAISVSFLEKDGKLSRDLLFKYLCSKEDMKGFLGFE